MEILFRGKRIDTGEWIQGYLFKSLDDCYICWGTDNGKISNVPVIPETVGQYTGLDDKNGVKIFGGDVIRVFGNVTNPRTKELIPYNSVATVRYEGNIGCFLYHVIGSNVKSNFRYIKADGLDYEIIGNIHDPELMGEQSEKP